VVGDFSDLIRRRPLVPNGTEHKRIADERVIHHLKGYVHLEVMERLYGLTTSLSAGDLDQ
jgi:hypothetical protein